MSGTLNMGQQFGMAGMPVQQQFVPAFASGAAPQAAAAAPPLLVGQRQPLPKQLTTAIKSCTSLERLAQLFAAHQAVLNPIHIAAMITKLPKLDSSVHNAAMTTGADLPWILSTASAQQVQLRQLLQQLLLRLKVQGCGEYSPRGVANIVWALAKLQCAPDSELRRMLLDKFCSQLPTAVPQDVSNVLWGVAKITKERSAVATNVTSTGMLGSAPVVLQPMGVAGAGGSLSSAGNSSSPSLAGSNISQHTWGLLGPSSLGSSGVYDAAAAAVYDAPLLAQDQVRLLLQHLCQQLHIASVQTISNSLWAVVVLQQEHQWCMCNCLQEVQLLLSAICRQPHQALPGHIQPVIRCMAQLATTCSNHAGDSWIKWQPQLLKLLLEHLCNQQEHMEMHHVSSVLRDVAQVVCLHLLLTKQLREKQQQLDGEACSFSSGQSAAVSRDSSSPTQTTGRGVGGMGSAPYPLNTISAAEEAEEVLARLAASGGPQDASSTVVALAMLQPQLKQLELQQGVAGLCSMLPPAALPHLAEEDGQRLLAAASSLPPASPTAAASSDVSTVAASAARRLQAMLAGQRFTSHMPPTPLGTPSAAADSSSADNSSCDNAVAGAGEGGSAAVAAADAACSSSLELGAGAAAELQPPASQQHMLLVAGANEQVLGSISVQQHDGSRGTAVVSSCLAAGCTTGGCPGAAGGDQAQQQQQRLQGQVTAGLASGISGLPSGNLQQPAQQQQQLMQPAYALGDASVSPAVSTTETHSIGLSAGGSVLDDLASTGADTKEEAAARQLTHNIANADSVYQLAEIFTAHAVVMDMIHITACITRLSKVLGSAPTTASQAAAASLLPMLGSKLLQVLPNANARGIANVLWGYGRLRNLPQSELLPELLEAFLRQLPNAACRDSAVVLWSLARLTEGAGLAAIGVAPDLLLRLGRAVLEQLAATAAATAEGVSGQAHLPQQQTQADEAGSSSTRLPDMAAARTGESAAAPSSRDISNSLMALTRLGFMPESVEGAATAASGAPAGGTSTAASTGVTESAAADQAAAAADLLQRVSVHDRAVAAAPGQQHQLSEQPPAAGDVSSREQPAEVQAAAGAAQQQVQVQLTLPVSAIQIIVKFLLHHAPTAKTLDLQEAATALKQLGLMELHSQVAAAISAPQFSSQVGHGGGHHGSSGGHSSGSSSMQFINHMAAAAGVSGGGSPMVSGGLHGHVGRGGVGQFVGSSGAASAPGRGAVGFASASGAVLARSHHGQQQQPPGHQSHVLAVSVPANLNLSGTQLAGLLQQQRRQQPLQISGPAYGAGWLPGNTSLGISHQQQLGSTGSRTACMLTPGGSTASAVSKQQQLQQQQQQQQFLPGGGVMYMPAGSSGACHMRGQQVMPYGTVDLPDVQPGMPVYQGGSYMPSGEVFAQQGAYSPQHGMQQQQQQLQQLQQRRPHSQHQQWQQQQPPMPARRVSGVQQSDLLPHQVQQPGYTTIAGQRGGVQYVFVPQQPQQQQGAYLLQDQQQQQQQRSDLMLMQQALQEQGFPGQQQQQQPAQPMVMVPASMGAATGLMNLGQPVVSMAGQQPQGLSNSDMMMNAPGVAIHEPWLGQQQQQNQQLMQMLPQLQTAAAGAGTGGRLSGQLMAPGQANVSNIPFQVSGSMLMPTDYAQADFAGQQQLQMYNFVHGASQYQQQQQPAGTPGVLLPQQQQQQMDTMQAAQMYAIGQQGIAGQMQPQQDQLLIDPAAAYAFNPAQMQP